MGCDYANFVGDYPPGLTVGCVLARAGDAGAIAGGVFFFPATLGASVFFVFNGAVAAAGTVVSC